MKLPYDVARCNGYQVEGELRDGCEDCLRRTSKEGPISNQTFIAPPVLVVFECESRIPPDKGLSL